MGRKSYLRIAVTGLHFIWESERKGNPWRQTQKFTFKFRPIGKPPFHLRSRTLTYAPVLRPFYTRFHKLSGLLTSDRYKRFGFGATRVVTLRIYTYLLSSRRLLSGYSTFLASSLTVPHSCRWKTWGSRPVARGGIGFERGTFFSSIRLVSNYIRPVDVIRSSTPTPSTI